MNRTEEIKQEILEYKKLSDEDKLKWLNDCLLFNYYAFSDEDKKKREKIAQILDGE
jgi:hypothetical protein